MQQKRPSLADEKVDLPWMQLDKRQDTRFTSHASLIFTPFGTRFNREYASMTFNHSRSGMCMEASQPYRPGSVLYIRLGNATEDEDYSMNQKYLRTTTLAEVKWCREQHDKFGTYYRIGVRYF